MRTFQTTATVDEQGRIEVKATPFAPGQRVKAIVMDLAETSIDEIVSQGTFSAEEVAEARHVRARLRDRLQLRKHENPNEPVALDDWDLLRSVKSSG